MCRRPSRRSGHVSRPNVSCRRWQSITQAPDALSFPSSADAPDRGCLPMCGSQNMPTICLFYRQSGILPPERRRGSWSVPRSPIGSGARLPCCSPWSIALAKDLMASDVCTAMTHEVPVLAAGNRQDQKTGRLWAYVRDERPMAAQTRAGRRCSSYSPDRKSERPQEHLNGCQVMHAMPTAYAGSMPHLSRRGAHRRSGLLAHSRRKFFDVPPPEQLARIAQRGPLIGIARALYGVEEKRAATRRMNDEGCVRARAKPLIDDLHAWLAANKLKLSTKSDLAAGHPLCARALDRRPRILVMAGLRSTTMPPNAPSGPLAIGRQELPLRRLRQRRRTRRRHLLLKRNRRWAASIPKLFARCARPPCRPSHQQDGELLPWKWSAASAKLAA